MARVDEMIDWATIDLSANYDEKRTRLWGVVEDLSHRIMCLQDEEFVRENKVPFPDKLCSVMMAELTEAHNLLECYDRIEAMRNLLKGI